MKHRRRLTATLLLLLAVLSGCGTDGEAAQAPTAEETAEQFLTLYYTADADGRYAALAAEPQSAGEAYYAPFAALTDQDCLENMQANRRPVAYDRAHQGKTVEVTDVSVGEPGAEQRRDFTVTVLVDGQEEVYTGELAVTEGGAGPVVSYFWPDGI